MVTVWDDKYHTKGVCWDISSTTGEKGRSLLQKGAPRGVSASPLLLLAQVPDPHSSMATHLTAQLLLCGEEASAVWSTVLLLTHPDAAPLFFFNLA